MAVAVAVGVATLVTQTRPTATPVVPPVEEPVALVRVTTAPAPEPVEIEPARAALKRDQAPKTHSEQQVGPDGDQDNSAEERPRPRPERKVRLQTAEVGSVSVTTDSPLETFVYLNGGTLLGRAPLSQIRVPAGRHSLVFWTPQIGGRARRDVEVAPGETLVVTETVAPRQRFE